MFDVHIHDKTTTVHQDLLFYMYLRNDKKDTMVECKCLSLDTRIVLFSIKKNTCAQTGVTEDQQFYQ